MTSMDATARFRAFIVDLDGVVYRGLQLLPGAREFVAWADQTGRRTLFLSNNSFATMEEVAEKLARLDIPQPQGRVLTAGQAAAQVIAERFPGGRVYAMAVGSIERMLQQAGLRVVWREEADGPTPDAVVVGLDRTLTYARLSRGLRAVMDGAAFYAVNRDPRLPVESGFEPGTGAIVAALEYASDVPAQIIGKPAPEIVLQALHQMGVTKDETLMIGDGLDLDIVAGHAAGLSTALVLSGLTTAAEAQSATGARRPDFIYADLAALLDVFRGRSA